MVAGIDGVAEQSNTHGVAFVSIKLHVPFGWPLMQCVKIFLESCGVLDGRYRMVDEAYLQNVPFNFKVSSQAGVSTKPV